MEWDNPSHYHPEWNPQWRYLPQYACSSEGEEIPLIWNNSISFQKFQRYVCREMELEEHVAYLEAQLSESSRAFPLYGNDIEVFDFRPGRYATEPKLQRKEWKRIERLFQCDLVHHFYFILGEFSPNAGLLTICGFFHS